MRHSILAILAAAALFFVPANADAQALVDPSGHWEGTLIIPNGELEVAVDIARVNGALSGTISVPSQQLNGMPLASVQVDAQTVTFTISNNGGTFTGQLANSALTGDFAGPQGSTTFTLKRTGDAKLAGPPRGAPLAAGLEGTWVATLEANGRAMRLQLTMSNRPDGSSIGRALSLDEGNLELPIEITSGSAATFAFKIPVTGSAYSGVANAALTEIAGTYEQRGLRLPLTFVRAPKP